MPTESLNPEQELQFRRELGLAMVAFVQKIVNDACREDDVLRRIATDEYRQAVEIAAARNIESSLAWHTLGVWTEVGKERIGCFSRALDCCRREAAARTLATPRETWTYVHTEADCLFEIGRVHAAEGASGAASRYLAEALPLARRADSLQAAAGVEDDRLEGKIAELLLKLPE